MELSYGRSDEKRVRFLPLVAALLLMVLALWGCGDISMLTAFKKAEAVARYPQVSSTW